MTTPIAGPRRRHPPADQQPDWVARLLVRAIESCWTAIRTRHPELPDTAVTIAGSHSRIDMGQCRGQLHWRRPRPGGRLAAELLVDAGDGLPRGARPLLASLIHQAAHALAHARAIPATGLPAGYHTAGFADVGRELGLTPRHHPSLGWAHTDLAADTAERYLAELVSLEMAITSYRLTYARTGHPTDGGSPSPTAPATTSVPASWAAFTPTTPDPPRRPEPPAVAVTPLPRRKRGPVAVVDPTACNNRRTPPGLF